MESQEKYIMFLSTTKGNDGYSYIGNVKYKVQKETANAFYLAGMVKKKLNRFVKASLAEGSYVVAKIIID